MIRKQIMSLLLSLVMLISVFDIDVHAADVSNGNKGDKNRTNVINDTVNDGINYIASTQNYFGMWDTNNDIQCTNVVSIVKCLSEFNYDTCQITDNAELYYENQTIDNTEAVAGYCMGYSECGEATKSELLSLQNPDGGFGLALGYESDIMDTKAALKALQFIDETDAMESTIAYIVSCQNPDGGFPYQPGLESDAELSADIANILADCFTDDKNLQEQIESNLISLRSYLDENAVYLSEFSSSDLGKVYQHFNTALFKLKMDKEYDVTSYYDLQEENGSVYDDALATAMYLELLVLEENTIKADINDMVFVTDEGTIASVYNSYENVNIIIDSSYNSEEARLEVDVKTPSGEIKELDSDDGKYVFETADYEKGLYQVTAKIINTYNNKVVSTYDNYFTINPTFAVEGLDTYFAEEIYDYENYGPPEMRRVSYARKGVKNLYLYLMADVHLKNLEEATDDITISWELKRKTKVVTSGWIKISKRNGSYMYLPEVVPCSDGYGVQPADDFVVDGSDNEWIELDPEEPDFSGVFDQLLTLNCLRFDTTESCSYVLQTDVSLGDMLLESSMANLVISGQEMSVVTNTDKEELIASEDEANISVKLREKKTVDLVLSSGTDDVELVNKYADKIEDIKTKLEKMGYTVNVGAAKSKVITAEDRFEWQEYDHINYKEPRDNWFGNYNIPKHIIYDGNDIRMVGYCEEAKRDFLFVEGNDDTKKILEFDVQREDDDDWHTLDGAGFLFNTEIKDGYIEGYCVLVQDNGINMYKMNRMTLERFREGGPKYGYMSYAGYSIGQYKLSKTEVMEKHHLKVVVEDDKASVYDNDSLIISNAYVGSCNGKGYGPITCFESHCCEQISSFRFSNITMKSVGGKSLRNILDNYNFESYDSRYVISVSDVENEELTDVNNRASIAYSAKYGNITLLSVGNDNNRVQYNYLYEGAEDSYDENGNYIWGYDGIDGQFYELSDSSTLDALEEYIISHEESKYVVSENDNKSTNLVFTGTLYDGSTYIKEFDHLYEGEQIDFNIPQTLSDLVVGKDAPLLRDITLTYTDSLGETKTATAPDIYLPVTGYTKKITDRVTTDNDEYMQYSNAEIAHRIYNKSDKRTAKNLVSVINVKDSNGNVIDTFSKELGEIMVNDFADHKVTWNTADNEGGEYTIETLVYDGTYLVAQSTKTVIIKERDATYVDLSGNITLSKKILKNTDELEITKKVKNEFKNNIDNVKERIRIVNAETIETVYESETLINLEGFGEKISEETVVAINDFSNDENGEYIIIHEAELDDGRIIELEGDGFILETKKKTELKDIFGDGALISLNKDEGANGIELDGAIITVGGTMHSNTNIEVNTSILNISSICEAVLPITFNAMVTNITNGTRVCGTIDVPEIDGKLSGKDILIESPIYDNYADNGTLLASEGNITIRSSYARFKGLIYAPNGTVTIESSTFNMEGRIIAKNIVYKGSVLNVSSYDGDLDFLK